MKLKNITPKNITSGDMEESEMGINKNRAHIATYFLRDKIYEDKKLAVVREYTTNGIDEHRKHGITKKVDVSVVGDRDEGFEFKVRDYANGLSDEDVRNVFGMYFESTKDADNDSMGGFGIGSKAGHSYSDTFYVTSHYKGTQTIYICPLDQGRDGIPIGKINKISECPTKETGIEITVPLGEQNDRHTFDDLITSLIENTKPDAPVVGKLSNGDQVDTRTEAVEGSDIFFAIKTVKEELGYGDRKIVKVRMGDICYKVPSWSGLHKYDSKMIGKTIVDVPVGKLTLAISRESIERTKNNEEVFKHILAELDSLFEAASQKVEVKMENFNGSGIEVSLFRFTLKDLGLPNLQRVRSVEKHKNLKLVAVPNNRATDEWVRKLVLHASKPENENDLYYYYKVANGDNSVCTKEKLVLFKKYITGKFEVDHVKKLKIKNDNGTGIGQYVIYHSRDGRWNAQKLTPQEFMDDQDIKIIPLNQMNDIYKIYNTCVAECGSGYYGGWIAQSVKMREGLEALGMRDRNDPKVVKRVREIKDTEEKARTEERKVEERKRLSRDFNGNCFGYYTPKLSLNTDKSPSELRTKRLERIKNGLESVKREKSVRGEIVRKLERGYGSDVSRRAFREIMKLTS